MFHSFGDNRSCELKRCPTRELFGWLSLRTPSGSAVYEVDVGDSPNVYLLRQVSPVDADEIYEVAVVRQHCYCNCKGFSVRKECKHSAGWLRLHELGLLADVPQADEEPPF